MKNKIIAIGLVLSTSISAFAGNKDRSGQGAASQLLINPWAMSGGVFGLNAATVNNVEAMKVNIAGLANIKKGADVGISFNKYLSTYGSNIVNAAVAMPMGSRGTLGANIMSINMGDIPITTTDNPSGNIGMFKPSIFNASIGYGHRFDKNINGGLNFTFLSEGVSNVKAGAIAIDAGIQYTAGDRDNVHFGVTLRNVGSNMRFNGDGLAFESLSPDANSDEKITVQQRSDRFQLPTQLNIAGGYDIYFGNSATDNASSTVDTTIDGKKMYGRSRLTLMGSFISNSFNSDYIGLGAEFAFKEQFFLRAGFRNEQDIFSSTNNRTIYTGVSAGAGAKVKYGSKGGSLQVDYSFKPTRMFSGVHTFGLRFVN